VRALTRNLAEHPQRTHLGSVWLDAATWEAQAIQRFAAP